MSTREPITPVNGVIPFNIGIAPAVTVTVSPDAKVQITRETTLDALRAIGTDGIPESAIRDAIAGNTPEFDGPSRLIIGNWPGDGGEGPSEPLVGTDGESLNSLTWPAYLAWRKTKCRPFDRPSLLAVEGTERLHEEIDQATLEMIGEVAELGELFSEQGPTAFWGTNRDKLIDECGDVFFCSAWALDAWGENPLYGADDLEMLRVSDENEIVAFAAVIGQNEMAVALGNPRFVSMLGGLVFNLLLTAQTNAGLTANSYKKLHFQRREQSVEKQVARIASVLITVNQILIIANSSVEEALKVNMRKLDARRPGGYNPAVPGGIRTGEGK